MTSSSPAGNGTVLLGNLNPGMVAADFMRTVLDFIVHDQKDRQVFHGYLPWLATANLSVYRNQLCEVFLQTDYEWLWFVDSDVIIDNTTLYAMLDVADSAERPVVTGIYPQLCDDGVTRPCLYRRGPDPKLNDRITMVQHDETPEAETVDGCGAGCLLIHRSLLDAMLKVYEPPSSWFMLEAYDGIMHSEDLTFCMRVAQMGFPITLAHDAVCHHQKLVKLQLPTKEKV